MARRPQKAPEAGPATEPETVPELTMADRIPTPGAVFGPLWQTITSLPSALPGLIGDITSGIAPDREAGQ